MRQNDVLKFEFDDAAGVATLTLHRKVAPVGASIIDAAFAAGLEEALGWLEQAQGLRGVIVTNEPGEVFCAGADLDTVLRERDAKRMFDISFGLSRLFRRLETCGVPVVAALAGTALGGGYELALACHHRVALDDAGLEFGLPEVQLGLLPGAGGTQRLPRMLGIQPALELIVQGQTLRAPKAHAKGLVDGLAAGPQDLRAQAMAFIEANPDSTQPWDRKKPRFPGPRPHSADARNLFMGACAMVEKKTAGAYQAPRLAISAMQEGMGLTFDRGLEVESRYFTQLAISDQAKNMIRTLWFFRRAAKTHREHPSAPDPRIHKIAILGAGMMGAGLAFIGADAGYEIVLKDIDQAALAKGVEQVESLIRNRRKHLAEPQQAAIRDRILGTVSQTDLDGADLVIEAVFENLELKHGVTRESEPHLGKDGIWASNTSALPIGELAKASQHPDRFIGLHFFSPVEKMPLVEVIVSDSTSEETLARALSVCDRLGKIPIVVGDAYAFYTTRVFSSYILEAAQLVAEGHDPLLVEWAARKVGMAVAPLQVFDEVTLTLGVKASESGKAFVAENSLPAQGLALVRAMVDDGREGKSVGAGFYEYEKGKRRGLWPGLADYRKEPDPTGVEYLADRLLLIQAVQAARCVEIGVIREPRDAEVGAVFGLGFAPPTGGPLTWMDRQGIEGVVTRLESISQSQGSRYAPPKLLQDMAANGETFFDLV